ncbi:hypothetical protein [Bacillus sp. UMB0728]|uniref:hypothetical protein n=1 Tax=Bacillus sp. UMB0728 TaxID=2066052 RepID=UPI000C789ECF|nr:hypothetical protein [Bacillus sp. UMB0728]PLR74444.1 hypothetical protein CYJ37_02080 [Bacillus sp. UMB0728]
MRRELLFAFAAFFFMSVSAITGAYAVEQADKTETVEKKKEDITGDGEKDTIYIKGIPYEEGAAFLKEVYVIIEASNGQTYRIDLEGGYEPSVKFSDLNHDGVKDLFATVPTGGSGGLSNYYLYTLKDFKLENLTVPEPLVIDSEFLDGYKASVSIPATGQSYTFDLAERKDDYERLGLYHNGKLNEPAELMVDPFGTLIPIMLGEGKIGLKGVQQISGAYHADSIAFAESSWIYENGSWKVLETKLYETGRGHKKR